MMKLASNANHDLHLNTTSKQKIGLVSLILSFMTIDYLKVEEIKKWTVENDYSK